MNTTQLICAAVLTAGCSLAAMTLHATGTTKRSISTVMKEAMKGETSLHKKVALGQGTDRDVAELLDYFKSLAAESPPQGDAASWKSRTDKLISAVQAVRDKKPGATAQLQLAGNCKACHTDHRAD